ELLRSGIEHHVSGWPAVVQPVDHSGQRIIVETVCELVVTPLNDHKTGSYRRAAVHRWPGEAELEAAWLSSAQLDVLPRGAAGAEPIARVLPHTVGLARVAQLPSPLSAFREVHIHLYRQCVRELGLEGDLVDGDHE